MKFPNESKIRPWLAIMAGAFLIAISMGCQGVKPEVKLAEMEPQPVSQLTLGPGDVIDIKFYYNQDLNDTQTVRPDGNITLQLIGDVLVQGKTPAGLRYELIRLFTPQLKRPEVAVIVRSLSDRRVYVGGEVNKPGIIPMPGKLTVLEAIVEAGGFKMETAKVQNVVVIRQREGRYRGSLIDFSDALEGKEVKPSYLEPRDIIYVPRTTIVKVDQWVDQHIYRLLPLSRPGFGISWTP